MSPLAHHPLLAIALTLAGTAQAAPPRAPASAAATTRAAREAPLDIQADRMDLDQPAGKVVFEGNVRASQPGFELRCVRLRARLAAGGGLSSLVAEGPLTVSVGEYTVRAQAADYDHDGGVLTLTGDPEVRRGTDHLTGARVRVWPDTGRVVVEQARGTVRAPALGRLGAGPAKVAPPPETRQNAPAP
jgi:lipopolysaccharide export system protein LptA